MPRATLPYLVASLQRGGMMFQSAQFEVGSASYVALTVVVSGALVASVGLFAWMLVLETRRTCRQRPQQMRLSPCVEAGSGNKHSRSNPLSQRIAAIRDKIPGALNPMFLAAGRRSRKG